MIPLKMAATITAIAYLFARMVFTWHDTNPVLFVLLLAAEIFGMWRLGVEMSMVGAPRALGSDSSPDEPDGDGLESSEDSGADAIVIVTGEPASEVRAAVLAARSAEGIRSIWIVDRDDRRDMTELARRLLVDRIPGVPGCDIGPLVNKALRRSQSDYLVLIPADVVVLRDVIKQTVPSLAGSSVVVVNCRVELTNASKSIDYGGYGVDQQRDRVIGPSLHAAGELPWYPGLAVAKRQELLAAGGWGSGRSGGTLDAGRRLRAEGWSISQSDAIVGRQLAAWNDDRQLHRWARELHEQLTVARMRRPGRAHGKSPSMARRIRSSYLVHVFQPVQKVMLIGVLFATLYTPSMPISGDFAPLIALWVAWHASSIALRWTASREIGFTPWITSDLRLMTTNMIVGWRVLRNSESETELVDRGPGRTQRSTLMIVLQTALMATLVVFGLGMVGSAHSDAISGVALGFALWLLIVSLHSMWGMKLRQGRQTFRSFEKLGVIQVGSKMAVIGVSLSGIDLVSRAPMTVGDTLTLTFRLPQGDGIPVKFTSSLSVMRSSRSGRHFVAYLRFSQLSDEQFDQIIIYCSAVAGRQHVNGGGARFTEVAELAPLVDATDSTDTSEEATSEIEPSDRTHSVGMVAEEL